MPRLSSRSRNTASPAYLRKSLAQVSQSYHKTMESRSGNLVNSAKSNSRVASAGIDKVTPFSRSFSLSLSLPFFISLLHHPSPISCRSPPSKRSFSLYILFFLIPSYFVFLFFSPFFSHPPLPSSCFFQRKFLSPLAFSLERIREYAFQRESWFLHWFLQNVARSDIFILFFFSSSLFPFLSSTKISFEPRGNIVYYGKMKSWRLARFEKRIVGEASIDESFELNFWNLR